MDSVPAAACPPPPRRPRVEDLAREAGVSTATVDRVLHGRGGVRAATVARVLAIAARLEYLPNEDLAELARPRPLDIVFVLPAGTNRYLRMLEDTVDFAADHLHAFNVDCRCVLVDAFDPAALARTLAEQGRACDGIAFMALDHDDVRDAVAALAARRVPVVTVVSDLTHSARAAYVGLDNPSAGRTAALIVARFMRRRSGVVGLIAGSRSYRSHEERDVGFRAYMATHAPDLEIAALREGQDDAERNYRQTLELLERHPHLGGIYNIGGASDGVARALKRAGREQQVVFVGHGLTPDTRALLADGTLDAVITQSPQAIVLNAVQAFANLRRGRDPTTGTDPIRLSLVLKENLP